MSSDGKVKAAEDFRQFTTYIEIETAMMYFMPESVKDALQPHWDRNLMDAEVQCYKFASGGVPEDDIKRAVAVLTIANQPCGADTAAKALTALRLRTKARPEHANDLEAMASLYAADLTEYPEDVVVEACKKWAVNNKWFPAWAELYDELEWRVRKRRLMLRALTIA